MRERTPRHQLIQTALFLSAGVAVAAFAAFQALYTTATTLSFEGRELGTVASEEEAQFAVRRVEDSISQVLGSQSRPGRLGCCTAAAARRTAGFLAFSDGSGFFLSFFWIIESSDSYKAVQRVTNSYSGILPYFPPFVKTQDR